MATLIGVYNSDGCVGRCDAKCYNAQSDHCECICAGMNHGAGYDGALANTREIARDQLDQIHAQGGFIPDDVRQQVLL